METQKISDNDEIDNNRFIEKNIKNATRLIHSNPWKMSIPDSINRNYLLPYRVSFEKVGDWHKYFTNHFGGILNLIPNTALNRKQIDSLIEDYVIKKDSSHLFSSKGSDIRLCRWPGLDELRMEKSGDCQSEAIKNVYLYRALGIPAAIDFTPFYGGGNAGHFTAVMWNSELNKFTPKKFQGFNPDYRVAKAFRWSFKKSYIWKNNILPYIKNDAFPIEELTNNHWIDVTNEHTATKNIELELPTNHKIAFICTYTYGQWRPIFYGHKIKEHTYLFNKMAMDVLYRGAYYINNKLILSDKVFLLKKDGSIAIINASSIKTDSGSLLNKSFRLERNNYGKEAWVKPKRKYSLMGIGVTGDWEILSTKEAESDSTINFQLPKKYTIFALKDLQAKKRLERPFLLERDSLIWY